MRKTIIAMVAMAISLASFGATPSDKLKNMAEQLQSQCPIDIHRGWVIQAVDTDDQAVTLTMIVDVTADQFSQMQQNADALKQRFLEKFATNAVRRDGLIAEAVASDLPLAVDIVSPESVESINIIFAPDELKEAIATAAAE